MTNSKSSNETLRPPSKQYDLYVGLSAPDDKKKLGSILIRWAEQPKSLDPRSWFKLWFASHTFIVFPAHRYRPFYLVNEAAGTSVRWISQPHFEAHAEIVRLYRFKFSRLQYKALKLYGELHSGAPYSFMENVGIGVVRLVKLFTGRTIANPFGSGEGAQKCSELVVRNVVLRFLKEKDLDMKDLSVAVWNERGYALGTDLDTIGVLDIFEILEFMADQGWCARVDADDPMRAEPPEMLA